MFARRQNDPQCREACAAQGLLHGLWGGTKRAGREFARPNPSRARRASHHSVIPALPRAAEADERTLSQDVGASTLCVVQEEHPWAIAPLGAEEHPDE